MLGIDTLLLLSVAMTLVAAFGRRYLAGVPYPTLMVFAGLAIAVTPGLPAVAVSPDVVKNVVLPPLLYSAAWYTTWATLRHQSVRVAGLSVGLVLATTAAVAALVHALHPELPLAVGLVLGAIVAPPDAIAAASISTRLGLPPRVVGLLEGESLINDATALIVYKLALGAVLVGGTAAAASTAPVSAGGAVGGFLWIASGGIALGAAVGALLVWAHRKLRDPLLETVLTLQAPYLAFLPAEALGISGVLAAVVAGLVVGRRSAVLFSAALRLQAIAVWDVVVFLLTGFAFVLIGLGVREAAAAASEPALGALGRDAALLCVLLIAVRIAWVGLAAGVERLWLALVHRRTTGHAAPARAAPLSIGEAVVVSWAGMRGVVSLAAALALPLTLPDGRPFPYRDEILVLTFAAIVATLVGQGLSLPALIRRFGLDGAAEHARAAARHARREAADAALAMLEERRGRADDPALVDWLADTYRRRRDALGGAGVDGKPGAAATSGAAAPDPASGPADRHAALHRDALAVERSRVIALRDEGAIDDEALHHVLRDLDLEDARLAPTPQTRGIA